MGKGPAVKLYFNFNVGQNGQQIPSPVQSSASVIILKVLQQRESYYLVRSSG